MSPRQAAPRKITYRPLADLVPNPRNPKAHNLDLIDSSVGRFGFVEPTVLDGRTGQLISGHGRSETLRAMEQRGDSPPEGVRTNAQGQWLVPVVEGWSSRTDAEASAALIALNRSTELGGWVDDSLLELLDELGESEDGYLGVGFDEHEIEDLRARLAAIDEEETEADLGGEYTLKADVPQYQITGERPEISELVDTAKADELMAAIDATDLPDDIAEFLEAGAQRHLVFDYAKIAEFYAGATPEVQRLMEASALVILDVDDAIKHGFARFGDRLQALFEKDLQAKAERGYGSRPDGDAEDLDGITDELVELDLSAADAAFLAEESGA